MNHITYHADEVIFRQGESASTMYKIQSGSVGIWLDYGGKGETKLAELEPGQFFGEMGLIDDAPRSATAVSQQDNTVLDAIPQEECLGFFQKNPELLFCGMQQMKARLRRISRDYAEACRAANDVLEAKRTGQEKSHSLEHRLSKLLANFELIESQPSSDTGKSADRQDAAPVVPKDLPAETDVLSEEAFYALLQKDPEKILLILKQTSSRIREMNNAYFAARSVLARNEAAETKGEEISDDLSRQLEQFSRSASEKPRYGTAGGSSFEKYIQSDLAWTEGRRELVRVSLFERRKVRLLAPSTMHVNPDDEFAQPSIGPCDHIIDEYIDTIRELNYQSGHIFEEPILVNKMACGEYLILNGHHRWAAAMKAGLSKVRASLANP